MSLKKNVLMNVAGQAYISFVAILMLPFYVRYLGAEAYGLVGFFVMIQQWLMLLDFGLTPTLSREMSRFKAGAVSKASLVGIVRSLEWFFLCLSVVVGGAFWAGSDWVAVNWLNLHEVSWGEASSSIFMMGLITGMRWSAGVYRSGLMGLEHYGRVNVIGVSFATARTVGALLLLKYVSTKIQHYFYFQLGVAFLEWIVVSFVFYKAFPLALLNKGFSWRALTSVARFAGGMAYVSSLWVATSQIDKLLLSHYLSLSAFGSFSVAATAAGGVIMLASPLTQALQSRYSVLFASGNETAMLDLYRKSTQLLSALVFSLAALLFFRGQGLLQVWTRNSALAREVGEVIGWYGLGNAIVAVLGLVFLIQFAAGKTRWHMIGCSIFSIVWLPVVIFSASRYGAWGVSLAWCVLNLSFLLVWTPFIHGIFFPTLKWSWLFEDVIAIAAAVFLAMWAMNGIHPSAGAGTIVQVFGFLVVTGVAAIAGVVSGGFSRKWLIEQCLRLV